MTVNVMFVNQSARFGGAERVLHEYLLHLDRERIHPIVVAPDGELTRSLTDNGITCVELNEFHNLETTRGSLQVKDALETFRVFVKLRRLVSRYKPQLLFTNSVKAHVLVNGMKMSIPTVLRLHDFPQTFDGMSRKLLGRALRNTNHVSCVSQCVADDVKNLVPEKSASVSFTYNSIPGGRTREKTTGHYDRKRIIIAGWLLQWKGFDVFADAVESIAEQVPDWEFVIAGAPAGDAVGSHEYAMALRERVQSSPYASRFVFHGKYASLSEIVCCPEHCIFVQPSVRPDPLPTVLFEAAALRMPIVTSGLGGSREIIRHNETGFVVHPSAKELADRILQLAGDEELRLAFGRRVQEDCEARFTTDRYVNGITEVIEQVNGGL